MASHETPTRLRRNRASRQNAAVVLLAVAVLAAVGSAFGYVLGTQDKADANRPGQVRVSRPTNTATPTARTGKPCPGITERAARGVGSPGDLRQRLYIKTDQSEVWICEDRAGKLWYQGHRLAGPFNQATGTDSLFLTTVNLNSDGGYLAVNVTERGRTDYAVYRDRLVITNRENNRSETQRVIQQD
jgi:hypothetical protein